MALESAPAVLDFWFDGARSRAEWFRKSAEFDAAIRERFGATIEAALLGALDHWGTTPDALLARIIVLDQFTRNAFRGSARAFAGDPQALAAAKALVGSGADRLLTPPVRRQFVYLPFEHAENLDDQRESLRLFEQLAHDDAAFADLPQWARKHLVIIERFGHFPHRNAVLGRASTADELKFLAQPDSSF